MSDEDLIAELRRTLHERAAGLRPGPGHLPGAETTGAQHGVGVTGEAYDRDPTSRLRVLRTNRRARPVLIVGVALAAAAAIAAAVSLALSGPKHANLTFTTEPTVSPPTAPPTSPPPSTVAPTTVPPPTTSPPTTAPALAVPVPSGFQALSVTYVSPYTGWAVGQYPCGTGECPALAATVDGGHTWSARTAPNIPLNTGAGVGLRFADRLDGWITTPSELWSTHDGGYHWAQVENPAGANGQILDLEAAAGTTYLVTIDGSSPVESVYSTPVTADDWAASPVHPAIGAGPVPSARLVLFGANGWVVDVDRATTSGARQLSGSGWKAWTPPCSTANGAALLGAASASDLVAVCEEGVWGTPDAGTQPNQDWLFRSSDAGATFSPVGPVPASTAGTRSITAAPGQTTTVVLATANGLIATFNGGQTWTPVYSFPSSGAYVGSDFVGFTTATRGVAILGTASGTTMVMTRDGGHSWQPVTF